MFSQILKYSSDQKRFMVSQIISSVYNSIISGVLMTGFLLYLGVSAAKVGVILSIPLLANVLQVPLARMWCYFSNSKQKIIHMVLAARLAIISIIFIPLLIPNGTAYLMGSQINVRVAAASVILLFAYIFAASSGIQLNYWLVNSIEPEIRGTFFAFRDKIVSGLTIVISLSTSCIIDSLKKISYEYIGFVIVFALATVFSFADYRVIKKIKYTGAVQDESNISIRQWISVIKKDKRFLRYLTYICFLSLAMNIANPYYNAYMIKVLHLNYTRIMLLTAVQVVVQIFIASVWGKITTHISWKNILTYVTLALGLQFFIWPFVRPEFIGLILIIFITSGMIATGLSMSQFMLPYEYVNPKNAVIYLSLNSAVSACGGFFGSVTGSNIISGLEKVKITVFSVEFGSMQINMVISGIMILLTVCYSKFVLKK